MSNSGEQSMDKDILLWVLGAAFTIIVTLLKLQNARQERQFDDLVTKHEAADKKLQEVELKLKDASQAKQIDLLFLKHDEDAQKLQDLELKIAQRHYVKEELDVKFEKLEKAFENGFKMLGEKLDKLTDKFMRHQTDDLK
jgi:biopolymer transport protein ExbB/TolQ